MTAAAAAAAPSMFAVFRRRDFSLLWLAQLVSTAGSALTDLAAGIYVWRETDSALAVGLTLMVTAIPSLVVGLLAGVYVDRHDRKRIMIWTCLVQAGPGRAHRVRHRDRRDRPARAVPPAPAQCRGQAVLRPGARQPHPRDRQRRGAGGGELVPVDRVVRLDGDRVRGRRPPGRHGRPAMGVHHRCGDLRLRRRLHRGDGPLPDADNPTTTRASRSS